MSSEDKPRSDDPVANGGAANGESNGPGPQPDSGANGGDGQEPPRPPTPGRQFDINCLTTLSTRIFDPVLGVAKGWISERKVRELQRGAEFVGHLMIPPIAVLVILLGTIYALKENVFQIFLLSLGVAFVLLLGQFLSSKFLGSLRSLVDQSPGQLATENLLNCLALVTLVGGVLAFLAGIYVGIAFDSFNVFLGSVGVFLLAVFYTGLALSPGSVNVTINPSTTPGQEAVGLIGFFFKTGLGLVPILYGGGLILAFLGVLAGGLVAIFASEFRAVEGLATASSSILAAIWCSLLPFLAYVLYLIYYLAIDCIQALLSIPAKIDAVKSPPTSQ